MELFRYRWKLIVFLQKYEYCKYYQIKTNIQPSSLIWDTLKCVSFSLSVIHNTNLKNSKFKKCRSIRKLKCLIYVSFYCGAYKYVSSRWEQPVLCLHPPVFCGLVWIYVWNASYRAAGCQFSFVRTATMRQVLLSRPKHGCYCIKSGPNFVKWQFWPLGALLYGRKWKCFIICWEKNRYIWFI